MSSLSIVSPFSIKIVYKVSIAIDLIPRGAKHDDTAIMMSSVFANILVLPQVLQKSGISSHFTKHHLYVHPFVEIVLPADTVGHEELSTVDDQSGEVTEKKHNDDADENACKIHLIVGRTIPV